MSRWMIPKNRQRWHSRNSHVLLFVRRCRRSTASSVTLGSDKKRFCSPLRLRRSLTDHSSVEQPYPWVTVTTTMTMMSDWFSRRWEYRTAAIDVDENYYVKQEKNAIDDDTPRRQCVQWTTPQFEALIGSEWGMRYDRFEDRAVPSSFRFDPSWFFGKHRTQVSVGSKSIGA